MVGDTVGVSEGVEALGVIVTEAVALGVIVMDTVAVGVLETFGGALYVRFFRDTV